MANKSNQWYKKQLKEYIHGCKLRIQNRSNNIDFLKKDIENTKQQIESAQKANALEFAQMMRTEMELKSLK